MGKLEGIIRFTGSFDGLSFYKSRGKIVVRRTGGFKGEAIKKQANYVRTRENASQFGYCCKVGKALRMALFPFCSANTPAVFAQPGGFVIEPNREF